MTDNQKTILKIKGTNVLARNLQAVNEGYRIICNQGGSRSSKTWSIFQLLIIRALEGRREVYTIARQKLTWVKATLLQDFKELVKLYDLPITPKINPNRQDQVYYLNGTEFAFFGLDYPEKLHGRTQDITWINEVMEIAQPHYDQLEMRTKKLIFLDYNPYDDQHWVFNLHKRKDVKVIRSTMLDNQENLPPLIINKILGYRPTLENIQQGTADKYMWEVYGLGKKGRLKGVIFSNWDIVDSIPPEAKDLGLGLDFGFANDPTALVDLYLLNGTDLYIDELIYETGLKNFSTDPKERTIVSVMQQLGVGYRPITADSSEPKSIAEIRSQGFNISGAEKGPDSILYGIELLKGYKLHITRRSVNIEAELRKYKWSEDKNGKSLNIPIDSFNHAIDATRYRATAVLGGTKKVKILDKSRLGL